MKGDQDISDLVSIRQAALATRRDPHYIHGAADALGITLRPVARTLVMTQREFERLRERIPSRELQPAST